MLAEAREAEPAIIPGGQMGESVVMVPFTEEELEHVKRILDAAANGMSIKRDLRRSARVLLPRFVEALQDW